MCIACRGGTHCGYCGCCANRKVLFRVVPQSGHRCHYCGGIAAWQSRVSYYWLCDDCRPCWCDYCRGRTGVHGADAIMLYQAKIGIP